MLVTGCSVGGIGALCNHDGRTTDDRVSSRTPPGFHLQAMRCARSLRAEAARQASVQLTLARADCPFSYYGHLTLLAPWAVCRCTLCLFGHSVRDAQLPNTHGSFPPTTTPAPSAPPCSNILEGLLPYLPFCTFHKLHARRSMPLRASLNACAGWRPWGAPC